MNQDEENALKQPEEELSIRCTIGKYTQALK